MNIINTKSYNILIALCLFKKKFKTWILILNKKVIRIIKILELPYFYNLIITVAMRYVSYGYGTSLRKSAF